MAKDGGMRYMVLTARHHDESALFDDSGSSFAAVKSAAVLHGAQVRFKQSECRLEMDLPAAPVEGVDAILKLELEQPWTTQAVIPVPSS